VGGILKQEKTDGRVIIAERAQNFWQELRTNGVEYSQSNQTLLQTGHIGDLTLACFQFGESLFYAVKEYASELVETDLASQAVEEGCA
jgi:hypothetical protein